MNLFVQLCRTKLCVVAEKTLLRQIGTEGQFFLWPLRSLCVFCCTFLLLLLRSNIRLSCIICFHPHRQVSVILLVLLVRAGLASRNRSVLRIPILHMSSAWNKHVPTNPQTLTASVVALVVDEIRHEWKLQLRCFFHFLDLLETYLDTRVGAAWSRCLIFGTSTCFWNLRLGHLRLLVVLGRLFAKNQLIHHPKQKVWLHRITCFLQRQLHLLFVAHLREVTNELVKSNLEVGFHGSSHSNGCRVENLNESRELVAFCLLWY